MNQHVKYQVQLFSVLFAPGILHMHDLSPAVMLLI